MKKLEFVYLTCHKVICYEVVHQDVCSANGVLKLMLSLKLTSCLNRKWLRLDYLDERELLKMIIQSKLLFASNLTLRLK